MDLRRMMVFRAAAHAGSIGSAARELGITQSALSQQLKRLEREAGTALVLRSSQGIDMTDAGACLLARADAIACELEFAKQEIGELSRARAGRIRIISFPSAATNLLPQALIGMQRAHPDVELLISEAEPPEAAAAVKAGDVHAAVTFQYAEDVPDEYAGLAWIPLMSDQTFLVTPRGWVQPGNLVPQLAAAKWIAGCAHCRQHMLLGCRKLGFEPHILHEIDDHIVVQAFVAGGLGVAVLPGLAIRAIRRPRFDVQALDHFQRRYIGVVVRPGAERVPAIHAVIASLHRAAQALTTTDPVSD